MKRLQLSGRRFGRLTVIDDLSGNYRHCRCDCGATLNVVTDSLRSGNTRSCGCLNSDMARQRLLRHGCASWGNPTPEYVVWAGMIKRCTNPRQDRYADYGGRGINVCERWRDFANFIADMGPRPSKGHSIERRDVNGHYDPTNCYWATSAQQAANRRTNRLVTIDGVSKPLYVFAREFGIGGYTVAQRLETGKWTVEAALKTPSRRARRTTP